jgi:REP element-mobilizing transposase RayT
MPHTSTHNYLHVVFGTKERRSSIPELLQPRLWAYMAGICRNHKIVAFAIGGMEDHVHVLLRLPPVLALARAISILKANSSSWMTEQGKPFAWQIGYGAFSVSASNRLAVERYIRNQKKHHRKMTFAEEYRKLLRLHGEEPD